MITRHNSLFLFLRQNWFRISVAVLVLYLFFQRDLSVQVQLNAPSELAASPPGPAYPELPEAAAQQPSEKLGLLFSGTEEKPASLQEDLQKLDAYELDAFIQRFVDVSRVEQEKFGIPASVVLATALYQSTAGHRKAADLSANNYFGLLCAGPEAFSPVWQGACKKADQMLYRQYQTAWESFRDFSYFACRQTRTPAGEPYQVWAEALGRKLYGRDPAFAANIIALIERYSLHDYDF